MVLAVSYYHGRVPSWEAIKVKSPNKGQWLCGSVGRAVASNTRGPQFESSHRQKFVYIEHLFPVNCVLKRRK